MFEFKRLFTETEKAQFIATLVTSIVENKSSYDDAIAIGEEKFKEKMSEEAYDDLIEHIVVDHTNYYVVAEKVANILLERYGYQDKDAFEVLLDDYGICRYDLPKNFVIEHLSLVEFKAV